MNIPTVKTIAARLNWLDKVGDPATLAKQIRAELLPLADRPVTENRLQYRFSALNTLLQTHGIEYITHRDDDQYGHYGITYLNTGDTYIPTICYNHKTGTLTISSWGDIVERHMNDYP